MSRWRHRSLAAIAAIVVLLTYARGVGNGFVWIDHSEIVAGRMLVTAERLHGLLFEADNRAGYYRPVYNLLHTLDYLVWGLDPRGFHLSSVCLHMAAVVLVFHVAARLLESAGGGFALALLWGLHPGNSAVVGLVHAKADLAVAVALLAAFACLDTATRSARPLGWKICGLAAYAVGLLTKETAFLYPIIVGAWSALPRNRPWRRYLAPLLGLTVAAGVLRLIASRSMPSGPETLPLVERLATFSSVYLDYLRLLAVPLRLSMADTVTAFGALPPLARAATILGVVAALTAQWLAARRWPEVRPWLLLFNLALLPVAQIVPTLHFRADRYLYLPSLAFLAALVAVFQNRWSRQLRIGTVALVSVLFAARVVGRLPDFADDRALFEPEIARTPDYREGLSHLAAAFDRDGQPGRAEELYWRALAVTPGRLSYVKVDAVVVNLTNNLIVQHKDAESLALARTAAPQITDPESRQELGYNEAVAAFNLGRFAEAVPLLTEYAQAHPRDAASRWLLGRAAYEIGDWATAADNLRAFLASGHADARRGAEARTLLAALERRR